MNLTLLVVSAYAAAMFGRLRSLPMTFLGAVILGLADSYAIGYISSGNDYFSTFRFVIPAVFLFVVLLAHARTRSCATGPRTPLARRSPCRPGSAALVDRGRGDRRPPLVLASILSEADALRASKIFGIALDRAVAGAAHRLRRPGVALPDELRRDRRDRHGAPRRRAATRRGC